MKIINDYNSYCQSIKHQCTPCLNYIPEHTICRGEAALSLLWQKGLLDIVSGRQTLILISTDNDLDLFTLNHYSIDESKHYSRIELNPFSIPKELKVLHSLLVKLFTEPRVEKWWQMCFREKTRQAKSIINFESQYKSFFVTDSSEMTFGQLLDSCHKAIQSLPDLAEGHYNTIVLADDCKIIPLAYAFQETTQSSHLVLSTPFNECNDSLVTDFRRQWCPTPSEHRICLMSTNASNNIQYSYVPTETPKLIYIPAECDLSSLFLLPNIKMSDFIDNYNPNIAYSRTKYICLILYSTTDVFGNTLITFTYSPNSCKTVLIPATSSRAAP